MDTALMLRGWRTAAAAVALALAAGCATQLAPTYDKAVVDGLQQASVDTHTLLATAAAGTQAATFTSRESRYASVIGQLDAIAMLAGARPVPVNRVTEAVNKTLGQRGRSPMTDDSRGPPSVHAIQKVSQTVGHMRDTDRRAGLTAVEVQAYRGQVDIYLDQALTYERFLER